MSAAIQPEVLDDKPDLVALGVVVDDGLHEALDEHPDLAALGRLPDVPRDHEHGGLAGEDEGHPHVVLVVHPLLARLQVGLRRDAGVDMVHAPCSRPPVKTSRTLFHEVKLWIKSYACSTASFSPEGYAIPTIFTQPLGDKLGSA